MATDRPTTDEPERPAELQAPGYEIFIGLLAIISLINLAIWILPFEPYQKQIAEIVDVPITFIFLADFFNRLRQSHPRRIYFVEQRGWLDLLGSLPAFFKLFRLFRLFRVYRLMKAFGLRNIIRGFVKDRADNALLVVVFMVIVVLEFGSMAVVYFEAKSPNANITTGGDAVWWAFVSITTVGYGDKYPVTTGGRISAFFVLAAGCPATLRTSSSRRRRRTNPSPSPSRPPRPRQRARTTRPCWPWSTISRRTSPRSGPGSPSAPLVPTRRVPPAEPRSAGRGRDLAGVDGVLEGRVVLVVLVRVRLGEVGDRAVERV